MICDEENADRCGCGKEIKYAGKRLCFSQITDRTGPETEREVLAYEEEILDTDLLYILFTSSQCQNCNESKRCKQTRKFNVFHYFLPGKRTCALSKS